MRLGLKFAILATGKTQRQIANETGILSENKLSEIVRGWAAPRDAERAALVNVLKQPSVALFGDDPNYQAGLDKYNALSKQIADVGVQGVRQSTGEMSTGTSPVGEGNARLTAQATAAIQQQLGTQQGNALTSAGLGQTQQELGQSALNQAGGLTQPSGSYPFVFDPATGQYKNVSDGGGIQSPQDVAKAVMSGQMTYQQAQQSLGYMGQVGDSSLQQAIIAAGGNPLELQAQGEATQQNIGSQSTAQTDIARRGLEQSTSDYMNMTNAAQYADTQAKAVQDILKAVPELNSVSSTDYNKALNALKSRFGDENFASLQTALIEARSAYANLLSTGGQTPSGNEAQTIATLDMSQPVWAINASIQQLNNAVSRRLTAQRDTMSTYQSQLNSGGNSSQSGGNSYTSGGMTFNLPNDTNDI